MVTIKSQQSLAAFTASSLYPAHIIPIRIAGLAGAGTGLALIGKTLKRISIKSNNRLLAQNHFNQKSKTYSRFARLKHFFQSCSTKDIAAIFGGSVLTIAGIYGMLYVPQGKIRIKAINKSVPSSCDAHIYAINMPMPAAQRRVAHLIQRPVTPLAPAPAISEPLIIPPIIISPIVRAAINPSTLKSASENLKKTPAQEAPSASQQPQRFDHPLLAVAQANSPSRPSSDSAEFNDEEWQDAESQSSSDREWFDAQSASSSPDLPPRPQPQTAQNFQIAPQGTSLNVNEAQSFAARRAHMGLDGSSIVGGRWGEESTNSHTNNSTAVPSGILSQLSSAVFDTVPNSAASSEHSQP